jgi:deoxyribonuclease V
VTAPAWPGTPEALDAEQARLAVRTADPWSPGLSFTAGGVFLAFARGQQGPGAAGDRGWVGSAVVAEPGHRVLDTSVVPCVAGARYEPGRLALREGPALEAAVRALGARPDVLLVDATGRDHRRRAGLALHLGAVLDVPTVGVTHRPLLASTCGRAGARDALVLDGEVVAAWVQPHPGVRAVVAHAAWRTSVATAVSVVTRCTAAARTPEPLRHARAVARTARAAASDVSDWRDG